MGSVASNIAIHLTRFRYASCQGLQSLRAGAGKRYNNAHDTEVALALYERAENALSCCHDCALNKTEIRSRLLQVALDHGMVP